LPSAPHTRFKVSVHFLEKLRHFISPKALLCFRVRVRVGIRVKVGLYRTRSRPRLGVVREGMV